MQVGIIGGTGALGSALALRLGRAGFRVCIGSRDVPKAVEAAQAMVREAPGVEISGAALTDCAQSSDIVFLTVPYAAHASTLSLIAMHLHGKILVDATVPLRPPKVGTVSLPEAGCAAVEAAHLLGQDVRLVSALQNIGAEKLASNAPVESDVLVASDDRGAADTVCEILAKIGLQGWHAGPLANSAAAEALTSVLIHINRRNKIKQAGIRITGGPRRAPTASGNSIGIYPVAGLKLFETGDDLATSIGRNLPMPLEEGDVIVVAQKVVSKVEGRGVPLSTIQPTKNAQSIASQSQKDPALVELICQESEALMRVTDGLIIARHRTGHVLANAGIDFSNVSGIDGETAMLWPKKPDESALELRLKLEQSSGVSLAVIVSDSLGRAWRQGTTGSAIGVSGMRPLTDRRGEKDLFGREMLSTLVGTADEIAAAASLVIGECAEGLPVAIVRGAKYLRDEESGIQQILRPRDQDLFQ